MENVQGQDKGAQPWYQYSTEETFQNLASSPAGLSSTDASDRLKKYGPNALPQKAETFPLLTGQFSGLRKFRVGDYRVIYSIIGETVLILRISQRLEAYR